MNSQKLLLLLDDIDGQLALEDKAKTGDSQSMIDFVRLCVFRKVYMNELIKKKDKIKSFEYIMSLIIIEATKEEGNTNG